MKDRSEWAHVPRIPGACIHVSLPTRSVYHVASAIAEAAWGRGGVRVYAWPCGTVAWVRPNSKGDELLLHRCPECLVGTWTKGAQFPDLLAELRAARGLD